MIVSPTQMILSMNCSNLDLEAKGQVTNKARNNNNLRRIYIFVWVQKMKMFTQWLVKKFKSF